MSELADAVVFSIGYPATKRGSAGGRAKAA
jgi:hypothetical protein